MNLHTWTRSIVAIQHKSFLAFTCKGAICIYTLLVAIIYHITLIDIWKRRGCKVKQLWKRQPKASVWIFTQSVLQKSRPNFSSQKMLLINFSLKLVSHAVSAPLIKKLLIIVHFTAEKLGRSKFAKKYWQNSKIWWLVSLHTNCIISSCIYIQKTRISNKANSMNSRN